ncbi:anaphase-promoting complex subunit 5 [Galendromus occidentalis]|uniref:Anaphase-promoting complex subunit 5 n=1 Tax=Galendromus occidentalis TaxID=34638 RepID=A0AAJ6QP78_9ACAR|nr:anaphase-promoting complex subunit 5 [Galendromus occidentalis]
MECAYSVSDRFRRDFSLTPFTFAVGVMVGEYCQLYTSKVSRQQISESHRRAAMILILRLIHSSEKSCAELLDDCLKELPETVHSRTLQELAHFRRGNVNAIFQKTRSFEKFFAGSEDADYSKIHKNSVTGMFLRKLILAINTLDFTAQTQFSMMVQEYVAKAVDHDRPLTNEVADAPMSEVGTKEDTGGSSSTHNESTDLESSGAAELKSSSANDISGLAYGRDSARAFLRQQGQRLRDNPASALPPRELNREILKILCNNPDMAEAYYVSFMSNLFFGEYVSAIGDCHKHFLLKRDIAGKKFRYALLNLAIIHKRFGHEKEAELALRESIDLSQQAGDHECLEQALLWLSRTNQNDMSSAVENSVLHGGQQQRLWLLFTLGLQTLSKLGILTGRFPSSCLEKLAGKHVENCGSPAALMSFGMSAAILWISYGLHQNAKLHCEMVLHLCYTEINPRHEDWIFINESVILAFVFCSRYAIQDYDYVTAGTLLEIADSLVPPFSELRKAVDIAKLCNECESNLHKDRFSECRASIDALALLSPADAELYKVRMYQHLGNYERAIKLINGFPPTSVENSGSYGSVIQFLLKSRVLIDIDSDNSFQCILEGLALCERYNLRYLECMFKLELVRARSRRNFSKPSLKSSLDSVTPMILAHGSKDDKLLLRSVRAEISENDRAIEDMISCYEEWNFFGDVQRSKVALNFIARKCHEIGDRARRNHYAKLFRILVTKTK